MLNEKRGLKADFTLITILIIPIAIAVNFIIGSLVLTLKLPLYLDSIGTFLVAILAGPWVGALTGFLSIAINSIADPTLFPFSIIACVLGFIVGFMARRKMFTTIGRFIIAGIITAFVAMVMSITISYIFYGGFDTSGNALLLGTMVTAGIPFWPAVVVINFISEVPDKFISLLVPYLVIRGMSERYLHKFSNGSVFIDARKAREEKKKNK